MSTPDIFDITPFVPKRVLVLPHAGGPTTLYVLDGKSRPALTSGGYWLTIREVEFGSWTSRFNNPELRISPDDLAGSEGEPVEVVFQLVAPFKKGGNLVPVIIAVSFDECQTFYANTGTALRHEIAKMVSQQV